MRVAYLSGAWDLLHRGHIVLLERASAWADHIVVGVLKDSEANRRVEKSPPAQSERERLTAIRAVHLVSDAFLYHTEDDGSYSPEIQAEHARQHFSVLIHGSDFVPTEYLGMGLPILLLPYTEGISSSALRKQLMGAHA